MNAEFTNYGGMCIARDFLNCSGDELNGSGHYYIGNQSSNLGQFTGTFTFHTPTGFITYNPGTVDNGVTITTGACALQVSAITTETFDLYPNPATKLIHLSELNGDYSILNMQGLVVLSGELSPVGIDVSGLNSGMYLFQIKDKGIQQFLKN